MAKCAKCGSLNTWYVPRAYSDDKEWSCEDCGHTFVTGREWRLYNFNKIPRTVGSDDNPDDSR